MTDVTTVTVLHSLLAQGAVRRAPSTKHDSIRGELHQYERLQRVAKATTGMARYLAFCVSPPLCANPSTKEKEQRC